MISAREALICAEVQQDQRTGSRDQRPEDEDLRHSATRSVHRRSRSVPRRNTISAWHAAITVQEPANWAGGVEDQRVG
jgi:hypothetical protein